MIRVRPMASKDRRDLYRMMEEQFSNHIEGDFMINKEGKVFLVSPRIAEVSLGMLNAEGVGLYIGKIENDGFRPSIEGAQMLKAVKNRLEIKDEQVYEWTRGFKLELKSEVKGYVIITHKGDFLGTGKSNGEIIQNYTPKARRIKRL